MCGICGYFHKDPARVLAPDVINKMTDAMQKRGPDGRGIYSAPGGVLGHRRLSIIDISGGQQPMQHPSKQSVISFNGEIYNYIELGQTYLNADHHKAGDTEILLHFLDKFGTEFLSQLNGMFAFAFWDIKNKKVILARDPVGQKPLFYHWSTHSFVFASSLNSLIHHPDVIVDLNVETLPYYLFFESYLHPHTPLKNVYKLSPGHALVLDLQTWSLQELTYWQNPIQATKTGYTEQQALAQFETTFQQAVDRHLRSDVEVGIFLSGGLDSPSLVKAACSVRPPESLKTFTIRHEQDSFNEADQAQEIANYYKTQHHEHLLTGNDFLNDVQYVLSQMDEPISDPGFLAIYEVVKFSSEHVKVILSGNGGDEFWAGYAPFKALQAYKYTSTLLPAGANSILKRLVDKMPASHGYMNAGFKLQRFLRGASASQAEVLQQWISAFQHEEIDNILISETSKKALNTHPQWGVPHLYAPLYDQYDALPQKDLISVLCHAFQQFFLPACICNHADKSSMMESQELRSPYLDIEMMHLANQLPSHFKYRQGQTKYLIRKYLNSNTPTSVAKRPKRGFTVPIAQWLTTSLKSWAEQLLAPATIKADGIFNPSAVQILWNEHQNHRANHAKALWTLIVFQHWYHTSFAQWKNHR